MLRAEVLASVELPSAMVTKYTLILQIVITWIWPRPIHHPKWLRPNPSWPWVHQLQYLGGLTGSLHAQNSCKQNWVSTCSCLHAPSLDTGYGHMGILDISFQRANMQHPLHTWSSFGGYKLFAQYHKVGMVKRNVHFWSQPHAYPIFTWWTISCTPQHVC